MSDQLPLAQVRIAEQQLPTDNVDRFQTVEVLIDGEPVARLPVTSASYHVDWQGFSKIRVELIAGGVDMISRPQHSRERARAS